MWIKNAWYVAAFSRELRHALLPRTFLDQAVVMFRDQEGRPVALTDKCPHRGAPLSMGKLIGNVVRCTYHGLHIGSDGKCKHIPCQDMIPSQAVARTFAVQEKNEFIWIWMGEAERADVSLIPDVHWMDDKAWVACDGYHHVKANYQLFNDNLLDLSHESFLHEESIGNEAVAEAPIQTTATNTQVRVHRDMLNCEPPPFYVKVTGFTEPINRWHTTIFTPPSYNLIENGSYPSSGSKADALERRVIHLVTPETATCSHYFWGVARRDHLDDLELTKFIQEQVSKTFDEDRVMLEAQQRSLGAQGGSAFPVALKTDAGPIRARRLVQDLVAKENPVAQAA